MRDDGRLVVGVLVSNEVTGEQQAAPLQLLDDGSVDVLLGENGLGERIPGPSVSRSVTLSPSGQIVLAGMVTGADWFFARY